MVKSESLLANIIDDIHVFMHTENYDVTLCCRGLEELENLCLVNFQIIPDSSILLCLKRQTIEY